MMNQRVIDRVTYLEKEARENLETAELFKGRVAILKSVLGQRTKELIKAESTMGNKIKQLEARVKELEAELKSTEQSMMDRVKRELQGVTRRLQDGYELLS